MSKQEKSQKKEKAENKENKSSEKEMKTKGENIKSTTKKKKIHFSRFYLFTILDVVALVLLIYLLGTIKNKAVVLNDLINTQKSAQQSSQVNFADLEIKSNQEKADKLISLFPNDQGLLGFIQLIEDKNKNGSVVNFNFASKEPVRDSTARLGIPVVVNFKGTWLEIDRDLRDIQLAPYLFRPITIESKITSENGVIELMYGGFLYVDESF